MDDVVEVTLLATRLEEGLRVTVDDRLRVIVCNAEVLDVDGAARLLVPLWVVRVDTNVVEMPLVCTEVKVTGQTVVDIGTTEVTMEEEPLTGQFVTVGWQLNTVM